MYRTELNTRDQHLLANGFDQEEITHIAEQHWNKIDDSRRGETLIHSCGDRWIMEGDNGRVYSSDASEIGVTSIGPLGYVNGSCSNEYVYGRISVAESVFAVKR